MIRYRDLFLAVLAAPLAILAGCTGSSSSPAPGPIPVLNPGGAPHAQYVVVANVVTQSLLTFNLGTASTLNSGNLTPAYNNHSASIVQPFYIFNDFQSNLWAADFSNISVTWYSISASGGSPTTHTLSGSNTTLGCPTGLYVDSHGNLYVADPCSTRGYPTIDYFASSGSPASPPSGNVAPTAWIGGGSTTLNFPQGISVDANGNLWVVDTSTIRIDEFSHSFSAGQNNVAPMGEITSSALGSPDEIYVDNQSHVWVGDLGPGGGGPPSLLEFASTPGNQTPLCAISGSNTGLTAPNGQVSVAVDNGGYVYGVDAENAQISIFAKGQCGNVTPEYTISGGSTGLTNPAAILVYSTGNDY